MQALAAGIAGVLALGICVSAAADKTYRWVDEQGKVHYTDAPPPPTASAVEEKNIPSAVAPGNPGDSAAAAANNPVVLYSVPDCTACDSARAHLKKRGVPFTEHNVEGDRQAQDEMKKRVGALAVPTLLVGSKVMKGYLASLLDGELDAAGYPKAAPATPVTPAEGGEAAAAGANDGQTR